MLNNLVLVGRLVEKPVVKTLDDGLRVANITLAVLRPYRSLSTGEFNTDFIPISLWYNTADYTSTYCDKGDIIGVKGRIVEKIQDVKGINVHTLEVIGDRVVFISLKSRKEGYVDTKKEETA